MLHGRVEKVIGRLRLVPRPTHRAGEIDRGFVSAIGARRRLLILWPAAMVGSQELPVLRRWCWGIWGLVVFE